MQTAMKNGTMSLAETNGMVPTALIRLRMEDISFPGITAMRTGPMMSISLKLMPPVMRNGARVLVISIMMKVFASNKSPTEGILSRDIQQILLTMILTCMS